MEIRVHADRDQPPGAKPVKAARYPAAGMGRNADRWLACKGLCFSRRSRMGARPSPHSADGSSSAAHTTCRIQLEWINNSKGHWAASGGVAKAADWQAYRRHSDRRGGKITYPQDGRRDVQARGREAVVSIRRRRPWRKRAVSLLRDVGAQGRFDSLLRPRTLLAMEGLRRVGRALNRANDAATPRRAGAGRGRPGAACGQRHPYRPAVPASASLERTTRR
jgi:hypothetical protein